MNPSKHNRIWSDWMAVTERAPQPQHAPRRAAIGARLPVGMAAFASIVVIVAIVGSRLVATPVVPGGSPSATLSRNTIKPACAERFARADTVAVRDANNVARAVHDAGRSVDLEGLQLEHLAG